MTGTYVFVYKPAHSLRHMYTQLLKLLTLNPLYTFTLMKHHNPRRLQIFTISVPPSDVFKIFHHLSPRFVAYRVIVPPISDGVCSEFIFYMEEKACCPDSKFTNITLGKTAPKRFLSGEKTN